MTISYEKLWQMMKRNKLTKYQLASAAEISKSTMSKLNRNAPVSIEIMLRFCKIFHCSIGDLMDVTEEV